MQQIRKALLALLSLSLLLCLYPSLATAVNTSFTVTDMAGQEITFDKPVEKAVALTASDCEIIFALEAEEALVGRGEYCDYPLEVKDIESVQSGYDTNIEKIIALEPDVLFMSTMALTQEQVNQLEKAGIRVVISDARDIAGTYTAIRLLGKILGKEEKAEQIINGMKTVFNSIQANKLARTQTIYFEVSPLTWGLWTAGTGTFMNEIAELIGIRNCFGDNSGWVSISQEQVLEKNPDFILTITMYYGDGPTPKEEIMGRAGWENVTAVKNGNILNLVNNELSRPGPRLAVGAQMLYDFVLESVVTQESSPVTSTPTQTPNPTPTPTPVPTPTPEPATVKKVQAKKSVKLQAPKAKGNSYQWYKRANRNAAWQSLGKKGAKDKLTVKATMALDGYQYRCEIKSASGVKYTDIYELYVFEQLKVKKQPKWGKASLPGSKMTLSVTATGASGYQWMTRANGSTGWAAIDGATGTSYVVEVQEGMGGRQYACQVTGKQGTVMSKAATVKMAKIPTPMIKKHPVLKKPVAVGSKVTLTVIAQNVETYQWYYRTSANGAWIAMGGETRPTVTITAGAGMNGYQYKCAVKGRGGSAESKVATLKVLGN